MNGAQLFKAQGDSSGLMIGPPAEWVIAKGWWVREKDCERF
jgi:hypothetical protein